MLRPARRDFRFARFFSSLLKTELTNPALWALAVIGETAINALKMKIAVRPRGLNLFINTP